MPNPLKSDQSLSEATLAPDGDASASQHPADQTLAQPGESAAAGEVGQDTIGGEPDAVQAPAGAAVIDLTLPIDSQGARAPSDGTALIEPLSTQEPGDPGTIDHFESGQQTHALGARVVTNTGGLQSDATGAWSGAATPSHAQADSKGIEKGYIILGELGRGGMGVVFKAQQRGVKRVVALKMILAGHHIDPEKMARFRTEAEAVAHLRHPNIVQLYEVGEMDGKPYFSLEYVDGGSLSAKVRGKPMPAKAAAEIAMKLAEAMAYAHQNGILHRDLKPANVLLAKDGTPKITDFGLAKRIEDQDSTVTRDGAVMGSPSYMAPEQAEGKIREVGTLADVYSLGAILYEMLSGRPPFKGETVIDTLALVKTQEPAPPRQDNTQKSRDLEVICLKCLQKDPSRRYATAKELADDLQRFLNDEPILARPTPTWERLWKWGKRRPATVALMGVVALVPLAMVLFIVWHNFSLLDQLDEARADERAARQREEEEREGKRVSLAKIEGQQLLHDARVSSAARDWTSARLHLTKALATIGSEPKLADLKDPAQKLLAQAEGHLRSEADFKKFGDLRDQAQFLGTLYTGMDLAGNLKATRAVVHEALAIYRVTVEPRPAGQQGPAPQFDPYLDDAQKAEVLGDCYQLLLILAETERQAAGETPSLQQKQHLDEALRLVDEALRFGVPSRAYHLRRARYLGLLGDEEASRQAEKDGAAVPVVQVLDRFLVGDEYYRRASFPEASKQFNQVLGMKSNHFWAQYLNAMCLLRQNKAAAARAQFNGCVAIRDNFVWVYLNRGFALAEMKDFEAAEADYQKAAQLPLDDVARYVLHVNRGVLYVQWDRPAEAIAELNKAIALKPNEYQAYVNLARAYRQTKKLDLALKQMDHAVELEKTGAHLYRLRARLHLERDEADPAERDFVKAIEHEQNGSPFLADDHLELGRLLLHKQNPKAALASFDAALACRPDYPAAQRLRAEALFNLKRFQDVIDAFDAYLQKKGPPLEAVYRGRGLARAELGKYPGAIEDYTKAIELQPSSEVYAYRGWAHMVVDAPKLALRDFETALELNDKNGDAYNGRGIILAVQGRHKEAIMDAEAALAHGPTSPRLVYNAARIHALCGNKHEGRALDLIRQALRLLPDDQRSAFWTKYIQPDAALQKLRPQPRFRQMAAELTPRT
jgi:tetratricopeptide (TPR) repeat protein/predicted Ser/Thr protein kinase